MTDLSALIERVESGTGADRGIDGRIWYSLIEKPDVGAKPDPDMISRWPDYTSRVDEVLDLIKSSLPGWCWQVKHGFGHEAIVWQVCKDYDDEACRTVGHHPDSAARALLAAALRAIQESRNADR